MGHQFPVLDIAPLPWQTCCPQMSASSESTQGHHRPTYVRSSDLVGSVHALTSLPSGDCNISASFSSSEDSLTVSIPWSDPYMSSSSKDSASDEDISTGSEKDVSVLRRTFWYTRFFLWWSCWISVHGIVRPKIWPNASPYLNFFLLQVVPALMPILFQTVPAPFGYCRGCGAHSCLVSVILILSARNYLIKIAHCWKHGDLADICVWMHSAGSPRRR